MFQTNNDLYVKASRVVNFTNQIVHIFSYHTIFLGLNICTLFHYIVNISLPRITYKFVPWFLIDYVDFI